MKRSSSSISWERLLPASEEADATDEFSIPSGETLRTEGAWRVKFKNKGKKLIPRNYKEGKIPVAKACWLS